MSIRSTAVRGVLTSAMREHRLLRADETLSNDYATDLLDQLNLVLDDLNAEAGGIYRVTLASVTTTASLNPHTIGPSAATWTVTQRPEQIVGATVTINSVDVPIDVTNDVREWLRAANKTQTGSQVLRIYYDAAWPNGNVYLWPVPTGAQTLTLGLALVLAQVALDDAVSLPPGYETLIVKRLARAIAPRFGKSVSQDLKDAIREAETRVFAQNDRIPRVDTIDAGMPGCRRGGWDNRIGGYVR